MDDAHPEFGGWLVDYQLTKLRIACRPCGRAALYGVKTLRQMLGNAPMSEVPRLVAIKGGCALAARYPGSDCHACFASPLTPKQIENIAQAWHAGWQLVLTCERARQALKSVKACPKPFHLDLESLVASLGHDRPIEALRRCLMCPGCGSTHYSLAWIAPKRPPSVVPPPKAGQLVIALGDDSMWYRSSVYALACLLSSIRISGLPISWCCCNAPSANTGRKQLVELRSE